MRTYSWLGLLAAVGCDGGTIHVGTDPNALTEVAVIPVTINRELDLLFVVDNSPSMLDKQTAMIASFPTMMDQLAQLEGGLPNVHIGVVTTDLGVSDTHGGFGTTVPGAVGGCEGLGKAGELQTNGATVTGSYISDIAGMNTTRDTNYTGALRDVFTTMASVGASGCGFEQTLGSLRRALDASTSANTGFLRHDANLAIVILSDEDDCTASDAATLFSPDTTNRGPLDSFRCTRFGVTCDDGGATPEDMANVGVKSQCHSNTASPNVAAVQPFVDYVKALKDDPLQVMVSAIVGAPTPVQTELRVPAGSSTPVPALGHSCTYSGTDTFSEVADPAVRIAEFVNAFGNRGDLTSVCDADLSLPLESIGVRAKQLMGDPCITVALANPTHPTCTVTDDTTRVLPACDGTATSDCWRMVSDPGRCGQSPDGIRVEIDRIGLTAAHYTHVSCLVAH